MNIERRIERLEGLSPTHAPLLISWTLKGESLAAALHEGQRFTQGKQESREVFLARLGRHIPADAVAWIEEGEETL